ncbi:hypothetical protein D9M68_289730 [compost metagenome]
MLRLGHTAHQGFDRGGRLSAGCARFQRQFAVHNDETGVTLAGITAFAETAEPERLMVVLGECHSCLGRQTTCRRIPPVGFMSVRLNAFLHSDTRRRTAHAPRLATLVASRDRNGFVVWRPARHKCLMPCPRYPCHKVLSCAARSSRSSDLSGLGSNSPGVTIKFLMFRPQARNSQLPSASDENA